MRSQRHSTCLLLTMISCELLCSLMNTSVVSSLTACDAIISLMLCSYCSARMASLRVCSSFRALSTLLCSLLGVTSSWWCRRALYCFVWTLHVSWNCFFIWSSIACRRHEHKPTAFSGQTSPSNMTLASRDCEMKLFLVRSHYINVSTSIFLFNAM